MNWWLDGDIIAINMELVRMLGGSGSALLGWCHVGAMVPFFSLAVGMWTVVVFPTLALLVCVCLFYHLLFINKFLLFLYLFSFSFSFISFFSSSVWVCLCFCPGLSLWLWLFLFPLCLSVFVFLAFYVFVIICVLGFCSSSVCCEWAWLHGVLCMWR